MSSEGEKRIWEGGRESISGGRKGGIESGKREDNEGEEGGVTDRQMDRKEKVDGRKQDGCCVSQFRPYRAVWSEV